MVRLLYCFHKWHKVKFFPHTPALPSSNVLEECQPMECVPVNANCKTHTHTYTHLGTQGLAPSYSHPYIHQLALILSFAETWQSDINSRNLRTQNSTYLGLNSWQLTLTHTHTVLAHYASHMPVMAWNTIPLRKRSILRQKLEEGNCVKRCVKPP